MEQPAVRTFGDHEDHGWQKAEVRKSCQEGWAAEARNYDYGSNKCSRVCGYYTQIVWGDAREVGCAVARGGGREVWVCEYDPPGNWVGKRPY